MKRTSHPTISTLASGILVVLVVLFVYNVEQQRDRQRTRALTLERLSAVRARLEAALNARLFLTRSVAAYVATYPDITVPEFQVLGRELVKHDPVISSVSLSKNFVISHIYPLRGHEAALGLDLLHHPGRRDIIRKIIETGRGYVAGPVDLVEGGIGFVGYTPILLPGGTSRKIWGLSDIVILRDRLFAEADLPGPGSGVDFAIRGKDGLGAAGALFWGSDAVFARDPETLEVTLPNGSWQLAAVPHGGWPAVPPSARWLLPLGAMLALVTGGYVYVMTHRPIRLQAEIDDRRRAEAGLRESEERFRVLSDKSLVGVYLLQDDRFLYVNERMAEILGRSVPEILALPHLMDVIFEDDRPLVDENIRKRLFGEMKTASYELRFKRKDGVIVQTEVFGSRIDYQGRPAIIGTLLDITDRKKMEDLRLQEQDMLRLRAERQAVEAQLRMLQAQIEPHFLFNTLANIVSLIERDSATAKQMLLHLTDSLRLSLRRSREDRATLAQETELLKNYLAIFRMRLGGRLEYDLEIPADLLSLRVPPMLIQPLVENAIVHGIEPQTEGGRITVRAELREGLLVVTVTDTGRGFRDEISGQGVGLANVRSRLQALFGGKARLVLNENEPRGVVALLEIPLEDTSTHSR